VTETLLDLYRHNTWANLKIIEYCERQPDEMLDASVAGTYGTPRATLMHLISSEEGYAGRLRGEPFEDRLDQDGPFPGFAELRRRAQRSGDSLLGSARTTPVDATLRVRGDEGQFTVTAAILLVQAINHATEHRAHIVTTLSALGVEPIGLDAWEWGLEVGTMRLVE
jgi:uncharacterized damage-inducible protein DinB